ncbi:hypothetical protein BS47DRAFT_1382493, partial [Hydnum rufescens UP504]
SPLDLALVISSLSLAVNSSDNDQHPVDTTTSPLFLPEETHNSHQGAHTAGPAPSYNQTSTIYPLVTGTLSNDTQFSFHNPNPNHNQPAPRLTGGSEDHFPSTSSFPSSFYYDQNVPTSSSAGLYHPSGALEGGSAEIFVSHEQLVLDNRTADSSSSSSLKVLRTTPHASILVARSVLRSEVHFSPLVGRAFVDAQSIFGFLRFPGLNLYRFLLSGNCFSLLLGTFFWVLCFLGLASFPISVAVVVANFLV